MAEASREMHPPVYRNGHYGGRHSNYQPDNSYYNSHFKRSAHGTNRCRYNNFAQYDRTGPVTKIVRETGLILDVHRDYGRILSHSNFSTPNIHIFFSLSTLVNDSPLSSITDNLADVFQVGAMVELEVEGYACPKELNNSVHAILTCISIKPTNEGYKPDLVPMVVIQDGSNVPLAMLANHELVALPRQIFPAEVVSSAFMAKKNDVIAELGWPEFASVGRSVEGRILNAPPWILDTENSAIKKIALSIQRIGRDREGFAVVKEFVGQGVILTPIDEEDQRICGDIFFPIEMRNCNIQNFENMYRKSTKWYFRACLELPNRIYKYRVYSLVSLEDAVVGCCAPMSNHFKQGADPCITLISTNERISSPVDASSNTGKPLVSDDHPKDELNHLINLDGSQPVMCSPLSSNLGNMSTSNVDLLVDLENTNKFEETASQARQIHVLDEHSTLSSFNFICKDENSAIGGATEMRDGCTGQENVEKDVCPQRIKKSNVHFGSADFSDTVLEKILPVTPLKEQSVKLEINDFGLERPPSTTQGKGEEESILLKRSSTNELDFVNVDDGDSNVELFSVKAVERKNNNGWWYSRSLKKRAQPNDELNGAVSSTFSNNEEGYTVMHNSTINEDNSLLILSNSQTEFAESASTTEAPHSTLSSALREDNIYAKFFSELIE